MLKRFSIKKIIVSVSVLLMLLIIYLIPSDQNVKFKQELSYIDNEIVINDIYLVDSYEYVTLTSIGVIAKTIEDEALEIIDILIQDGPGESKIPSGFKSVINSETIVKDLSFENGILKVNFSKELFDTKEEYEIKVLESLIYSLTSIKDVKGLMIFVDGKQLDILPKSKIKVPSVLDKTFGINKEYNFTNLKGINQVTIYYINKYNDAYYYAPVTKYLNDSREKVSIIVDELTNNNKYISGLMSFINNDVELLDTMIDYNEISLNFNQNILSDLENKKILEEVVKTINLSIEANYGIKSITYSVNAEPINNN